MFWEINFAFDWWSPDGPIPNGVDKDYVTRPEEFCNYPIEKDKRFTPFYLPFMSSDSTTKKIKVNAVPVSKINSNMNKTFFYVITCMGYYKKWFYYDDENPVSHAFLMNVSKEAIYHIRTGNTWLLINNVEEGYCDLQEFYTILHKCLNNYLIPPEKVIYSTSNMKLQQEYDEWCKVTGAENKIHILTYPYYEGRSASFFLHNNYMNIVDEKEFNDSSHSQREKYYLCLNRRQHSHRVLTVSYLYDENLLDKGMVSFPDPKKFKESSNDIYDLTTGDEIYQTVYEELKSKLPLVVDTDEFDVNWAYERESCKFYNDSYFSVVTETDVRPTGMFLSEKIWKPIVNYHPFIVIGNPLTLKYLRYIGYKTFNIDESYDEINDPYDRILAALEQVKKLCSMSKEEIHNWYWEHRDILKHNRQLLFTRYNDLEIYYKNLIQITSGK